MNRQAIQQGLRLASRARRLLRAGDVGGALLALQQAVELAPDHPAVRRLMARAQLAANQPAEALATLNALHLRGQGHHADARLALESLLHLRPGDRRATLRLAGLLIECKQTDQAVTLLCGHLHTQPADRAARRLLMQAHQARGDFEAAMRLLDDQPLPMDGDGMLIRARLARKAGRCGQAMDLYHAALRTTDDDAAIHLEAAELAQSVGDDEAETRWLKRAAESEPRSAEARRRQAMAHMRQGRFTAAGAAWRALERIGGAEAEAMCGLAVCALCADRPALAQRLMLRLAERVDAAEQRRWMARMWSAAASGRVAQAMIRPSPRETAGDPLSVLLAGAEAAFTRRVRELPNHADLHYHQGVCRMESGHTRAAAESLDAALRLNRGYVAAARRRLRLLIDEQDEAGARAVVEGFAAAKPGSRELDDLITAAPAGRRAA
jgi:tetratricopeptide (TPR) repeat protein